MIHVIKFVGIIFSAGNFKSVDIIQSILNTNSTVFYKALLFQNGAIVKFGRIHNFRFLDPCHEERTRQRHDSARTVHDYSYDR